MYVVKFIIFTLKNKMENTLVFIFCLLGVVFCNLQPIPLERAYASVAENETATQACIDVYNASSPIPGVIRPFFGKADIQPNITLKLKLQLPKAGFTYANISLDQDPANKIASLGLTFTQKGHSLFTKLANVPKIVRSGSKTIPFDKDFVIDISVFETGPGWGKYAYLVKVDGENFCVVEEQPNFEFLNTHYVSVIQSVKVKSVQLCSPAKKIK